jgi:hypothetical protein
VNGDGDPGSGSAQQYIDECTSQQRTAAGIRITFPLRDDDLGDTLWECDRTYMLVVLVGPTASYMDINRTVWMSDQVLIRLGKPSAESIYRSPLIATATPGHDAPDGAHHHRH